MSAGGGPVVGNRGARVAWVLLVLGVLTLVGKVVAQVVSERREG
jgi:hypothetical protein